LARADCASLRTRRLFGIWQQPYYIAQEIETTTDGMSIAIPEKEWTLFYSSVFGGIGDYPSLHYLLR
jgi:hypothetical protein